MKKKRKISVLDKLEKKIIEEFATLYENNEYWRGARDAFYRVREILQRIREDARK